MIEKFLVVEKPSQELPITTLDGLKKEVYTAVLRYFAPVAAIYEELEKTAGIPTAWQRRKLGEDRASSNHR